MKVRREDMKRSQKEEMKWKKERGVRGVTATDDSSALALL